MSCCGSGIVRHVFLLWYFMSGFCSSYIRLIIDGILCMCVTIEGHEEWELGESSRINIAWRNCGLVSPTRSPTWVTSGRSFLLAHLTPREWSLRKCKLPLATNQPTLTKHQTFNPYAYPSTHPIAPNPHRTPTNKHSISTQRPPINIQYSSNVHLIPTEHPPHNI